MTNEKLDRMILDLLFLEGDEHSRASHSSTVEAHKEHRENAMEVYHARRLLQRILDKRKEAETSNAAG